MNYVSEIGCLVVGDVFFVCLFFVKACNTIFGAVIQNVPLSNVKHKEVSPLWTVHSMWALSSC